MNPQETVHLHGVRLQAPRRSSSSGPPDSSNCRPLLRSIVSTRSATSPSSRLGEVLAEDRRDRRGQGLGTERRAALKGVSKLVTPADHRSVPVPPGGRSSSSGARNSGVPMTLVSTVSWFLPTIRAMPKSTRCTAPLSLSTMFAGFHVAVVDALLPWHATRPWRAASPMPATCAHERLLVFDDQVERPAPHVGHDDPPIRSFEIQVVHADDGGMPPEPWPARAPPCEPVPSGCQVLAAVPAKRPAPWPRPCAQVACRRPSTRSHGAGRAFLKPVAVIQQPHQAWRHSSSQLSG